MKKYFLVCSLIMCSAMASIAQSKVKTVVAKPVPSGFKSAADSFAYALGMNIGQNLKQQGVDNINYSLMQKGLSDVFNKKPMLMTDQQANQSIQQKMQGLQSKKASAEKTKGLAFLAANAKRTGVITLKDGLQYEVIKKGDAKSTSPKAEDTVVANYAGTLINGKEFDNSYKRGEPLTIKVNQVVKGWTEILQLMHVGDKWKVYIPSELGYGDRGAGADIPPGSVLIFDMELLGVKPFLASAEQQMIDVPSQKH